MLIDFKCIPYWNSFVIQLGRTAFNDWPCIKKEGYEFVAPLDFSLELSGNILSMELNLEIRSGGKFVVSKTCFCLKFFGL